MTPAETSAERYLRELEVDVSLSHGTTLRGRPSQYHANITRLLEMHALECIRHIESIVDRNPYVELDDEFACYSMGHGELIPVDHGENRGRSPGGSLQLLRCAHRCRAGTGRRTLGGFYGDTAALSQDPGSRLH